MNKRDECCHWFVPCTDLHEPLPIRRCETRRRFDRRFDSNVVLLALHLQPTSKPNHKPRIRVASFCWRLERHSGTRRGLDRPSRADLRSFVTSLACSNVYHLRGSRCKCQQRRSYGGKSSTAVLHHGQAPVQSVWPRASSRIRGHVVRPRPRKARLARHEHEYCHGTEYQLLSVLVGGRAADGRCHDGMPCILEEPAASSQGPGTRKERKDHSCMDLW